MKPPPDLKIYIRQFWESGGYVGFGHEKLVPSGTAELIFNLAGPQNLFREGSFSTPHIFKRAWVSGLFDQPIYAGPAYNAAIQGTHLVGVSIPPSSVYSLLGLRAAELKNQVVEAEDILGAMVNDVWHQLGDASSTKDRFSILTYFMRDCLIKLSRPASFNVLWALRKTNQSRGQVAVGDLCDELSVSRKHLGKLFLRTVGMSPKAYARLTRFRGVMGALQEQQDIDFAQFALDYGYSDQAHFINEFKSFAGESPSRFLKSRSSDGESVLYEA